MYEYCIRVVKNLIISRKITILCHILTYLTLSYFVPFKREIMGSYRQLKLQNAY